MQAIRKTETAVENIYINADQIKEYLARGYEILDDNGNKLEDPEKYAVEKLVTKIKIGG